MFPSNQTFSNHRPFIFSTSVVLILIACLLSGCGTKSTTEAGGTVKYDGQLLKAGTIEFYPVAGGRSARARIKPDGSFIVSYKKPGDGLPPGEYKVAVTSSKPKDPKAQSPEPTQGTQTYDEATLQQNIIMIEVVPVIYNDISTTPLRQTVTDESPQQLTIEIPKK